MRVETAGLVSAHADGGTIIKRRLLPNRCGWLYGALPANCTPRHTREPGLMWANSARPLPARELSQRFLAQNRFAGSCLVSRFISSWQCHLRRGIVLLDSKFEAEDLSKTLKIVEDVSRFENTEF